MTEFKIGDKVRFLKLPKLESPTNGDFQRQVELFGKTGVLLHRRSSENWDIEVNGRLEEHVGEFRFELDKPAIQVMLGQGMRSFEAAISKQHYSPTCRIQDNQPKMIAHIPTSADPLGQRPPKPVNCAICNKEYSGSQVAATVKRSIIGGMSYISPIGPINNVEQVNLGPCCARKVDEFILNLKTNRAPETTRKNATNSWMPHDEEGNL